jgi:hypothetical protein
MLTSWRLMALSLGRPSLHRIRSPLIHLSASLRPIARRVRQRALVIVKPNPIAYVDIAVAYRTFPKCSASLNRGPLTCLPITLPRGLGSSIGMIAAMCTSKKSGPGFPRPDPIRRAAYIRPRHRLDKQNQPSSAARRRGRVANMKSVASGLVIAAVLVAGAGRTDAKDFCTVEVLRAELLAYAPCGSWLTKASIEVRPAHGSPFDLAVREILPWQMTIRRGEIFRGPCGLASSAPSLAALATAPSFRSSAHSSSRYVRIR